MKAFTLTAHTPPSQRVDVSPLIPRNLSGLSKTEIRSLLLVTGNRRLRVDEIFKISEGDINYLIFDGETNKLDYIGKNSTGGRIEVQGSCGAYIGMGMKAGQINIYGNTNAFAACEMKGGLLKINGNSGDFLGSARLGSKVGMVGGTVIITGNVGDRAGNQMRRGNLLIEGNTGDYLGSGMIAGTVAVLGKTGAYPGYSMKRGTLLLWQNPIKLSTTFNDCGIHTLGFLPFMLASYKNLETQFSDSNKIIQRVRRYCGDMASLGRGEILIKI